MSDSPYRLTALTIACGLLSIAGLMAGDQRLVEHSLPLLVGCFAVVLVSVLGMFWTGYQLREDVRRERWSEASLAPFRRVVEHAAWKAMGFVLAVLLLVFAFRNWHHRHGSFWVVFVLLQAQTQISSAFRPPRKPRGTGGRPDWSKFLPLRSEHWGQRGRPSA